MSKISKNKKTIFLTGGGTGGSVSPLLAIYEEIKSVENNTTDQISFIWIGSYYGLERQMVEKEDIRFIPIYSGKLRRYFSWKNFGDILFIKLGFFQSFFLIFKYRPSLTISAGSFVSVPMVWASWLARVPVIIHQQDIRPGLANKLMAPFAKVITVSFYKSLEDYGNKAVWIGNLSRIKLSVDFNMEMLKQKFGINNNLPIVFITGGATGAEAINDLVSKSIEDLSRIANIIHLTGQGKGGSAVPRQNYYPFKFFKREEMSEAYFLADLVLARAGLSTLTELSILGKPAIIIPISDSHQEENTEYFCSRQAIVCLNQKQLNKELFISEIKRVLGDEKLKNILRVNIKRIMKPNARQEMAEIIRNLVSKINC